SPSSLSSLISLATYFFHLPLSPTHLSRSASAIGASRLLGSLLGMPRCTSSVNYQTETATMSELICNGCFSLVLYNRTAANVRCSRCNMLNSTRSGNHFCNYSLTPVMFPGLVLQLSCIHHLAKLLVALNWTDIGIHIWIGSEPVRPPEVRWLPDDAHVPAGGLHRGVRHVPPRQPRQSPGLLGSSGKRPPSSIALAKSYHASRNQWPDL
uniref:Zinc finger LSD1-type domain-containing protein n=1 Tax=Aegilops tauschii subsp. strangulata TaxID=200361 RepID=A0A453S0E7_AEGTS